MLRPMMRDMITTCPSLTQLKDDDDDDGRCFRVVVVVYFVAIRKRTTISR